MIERACRLMIILFLLAAGGMISGCAPVFPRELTDRVDRHVSFKELQGDPDRFTGHLGAMLGGVIVSAKSMKEGTLIEVLQKPLDSDGRPLETDQTEGRFFVVESEQFLDPAVYHSERLITVVAEVAGKKTMPIDEILYQFPFLNAKAVHLWSPASAHFFFRHRSVGPNVVW